jgi:putative ABC transport system substrate-binding protein
MFDRKRREFITLLGGATAAWPLAARAQRSDRMRRIGVLMNLAADDAEGQSRVAGFLQGMRELGWSSDRNMRIDIRWAGNDDERYRRYAAELAALAPDVFLASASAAVMAFATGDFHGADRIRRRIRPRRCCLCRQHGTAGR